MALTSMTSVDTDRYQSIFFIAKTTKKMLSLPHSCKHQTNQGEISEARERCIHVTINGISADFSVITSTRVVGTNL